MKVIILLLSLFLLTITLPVSAIGGHVAIEYDLMSETAMTEVDLHKNIDDLKIGLQMNTYLIQLSLKDGWMPAGVPESQFYRGYLDYKWTDNITFTLSNQCRHFFSQSHISHWNDTSSITVGAKYEF